MKDLIRAYPVVIEIPIAWGDMDAFQHVNNTVYFKHFEGARLAYFEKIGIIDVMEKTGIGPILASTQCSFKIPLTYPDQVSVGALVEEIGEDRFTMKYAVISHRHQKLAASGQGIIVTFDYHHNQKAPIPDEIRARIKAIESTAKDSGR